jgi:hypothetical protein
LFYFLSFSTALLAVLGALVFIIFLFRPEIGLYASAFFLAVTDWNFAFGPLLIPFVDLIALTALMAFIVKLIYQITFKHKKLNETKFPFFWFFLLFFVVALFSSFLNGTLHSLWYNIRWILFTYLAFVVAPVNIIKNEKVLKNTIIALVASTIIVAISGLISLYYQDWREAFFRVQPIPFFGVYPIGKNWNLLAEFVVVGAISVLALKHWTANLRLKKFIDITALFLAFVAILTFSRAAWIALAGGALVMYFCLSKEAIREKITKIILVLLFIALLFLPLILKMSVLQEANMSSTENRLLLTQIAYQAALNKPLFGYGSGEFLSLVDNNMLFKVNYGDPIDSHGVFQKVMAENGFIGLTAFVILSFIIFFMLFWYIKKYPEHRTLLVPLTSSALAAYLFQIFNTSYYKGKLWLPIALAFAVLYLIKKNIIQKKINI